MINAIPWDYINHGYVKSVKHPAKIDLIFVAKKSFDIYRKLI